MADRSVVTFVLGGRRSGKSRFAQEAALALSPTPVYLATARIWDGDFAARVDRHKADRDERWSTVECEKTISELRFEPGAVVVLDCITLWATNFFTDVEGDRERTIADCRREWDAFAASAVPDTSHLIVVSNEIGLGVHPESALANRFVDVQGFLNQMIAEHADRVVLMVAGIPTYIKGDASWLQL